MKSLYQFQQILIPELMNKMDERYQILRESRSPSQSVEDHLLTI